MNINNVIKSCSYLEFVNKLDSLVFKFLYEQDFGFINLKGKDAVFTAQDIFSKFSYEASKIAKEFNFKDSDDVINDKKKELIAQMKKHYNKEALNWADEIFINRIDNCLLALSVNKDNYDEIYNSALCAVSWLCCVRGDDDSIKEKMIDKLNFDFKQVLNTPIEDVLNSACAKNSDIKTYLLLWDCVLKNINKFINYDIEKLQPKLSKDDFDYFINLQNTLKESLFSKDKDEILLINSACEILNLDNDAKYNFIKQVQKEFNTFVFDNKKISEEDKINIVKHRMKLFWDIFKGEKISKYYKTIFLSNE